MSRLILTPTAIAGVTLVERQSVVDTRGWLERLFCRDELAPLLGDRQIVQINRTNTVHAGTVRGMHFQLPPAAEAKLVSCLRGEVYDVAVDLRRGSPTFLRCHGERLSADNRRTLLVPEGCAHGFQTLTADCEMLYLHTCAYTPESERGLDATDPRLAITWPLPIAERSRRDEMQPRVDAAYEGISL